MPDYRPVVREAYEEILGREPDPQGLDGYDRLMNRGLSEADMRESLLRSTEYAIKNPDRRLSTRLGLNVHLPSHAMLDDVAVNLGMRWIRLDFDWFRIEPQPGMLRWEDTDRVVDRAADLGLEAMATLAHTPGWASSRPSDPRISDPPASVEYWIRIVERAVTRYRGRLRFWQFWNEPNLRNFWTGTRTQYRLDILEAGARAAKRSHPACLVVSPGLANVGNWRQWFEEVMIAKDWIDIVNHHNYQSSGREVIGDLERDTPGRPSLRTLMRDKGVDDRPFWVTETGRQSNEGDQLEYYQDVVASLREATWVERLFFFHYWDGAGQGDGGFGIVNEDFTPKPAYLFLRDVLRPGRNLTLDTSGSCRS